jgi:hypothetical protein
MICIIYRPLQPRRYLSSAVLIQISHPLHPCHPCLLCMMKPLQIMRVKTMRVKIMRGEKIKRKTGKVNMYVYI